MPSPLMSVLESSGEDCQAKLSLTSLYQAFLFFVLHLLLHFVDPLQRLQTLIEQERRVVYQHVYIADKLLPRTEKQLHATQSHVCWQQMWWQVSEKNGLHPSATHRAPQSHQP